MLRRLITQTATVIMMAVIALVTAQTAQAQSANTFSFSESELNALLAQGVDDPNATLAVDLRPGEMTLLAAGINQQGQPYEIALTLQPLVANGTLDFQATSLRLNDFTLPLNGDNPVANEAQLAVGDALQAQVGPGAVQSFQITETDLTLAVAKANPNDPTLTVRDNLVSLTFTEAALNANPDITNPADPNVVSASIDLQPGRAVYRQQRNTIPNDVEIIVGPVVVNEQVSWQVQSN
ncbi:MAG: hypothetical protein AAF125_05400, partial [Chloroflexota bacterium]